MHNIEVGDLLIGPGQAFQVLSIDETGWPGKSDPYLELAEFPESDDPSDLGFGMTLNEAREWSYILYKPSKL